jgi:nicotinamidase/pyrazinamidase
MIRPKTAILIVDAQVDFVEGGALAVQGGRAAVRHIVDHLIRPVLDADHSYELVMTSQDWHGWDGAGHFALPGHTPDYARTWPPHCIAGEDGAELVAELAEIDGGRYTHIYKGMDGPGYSAFGGVTEDGRDPWWLLRERGIRHLVVCGIATDHCVLSSVLDACDRSTQSPTLETITVRADFCASVDKTEGRRALQRMIVAGADIAWDEHRSWVAPR